MKISYGTGTFAPDPSEGQHLVQVELLGGPQWKKGFNVLNLQFVADSANEAEAKIEAFLKKGPVSVKCPNDRKLSAAITGDLLRLVNPGKRPVTQQSSFSTTVLLNGVTQTRLTTSKYKITWYHTAQPECAGDLNYALSV